MEEWLYLAKEQIPTQTDTNTVPISCIKTSQCIFARGVSISWPGTATLQGYKLLPSSARVTASIQQVIVFSLNDDFQSQLVVIM